MLQDYFELPLIVWWWLNVILIILIGYWSESFRLFDADESGNIELDEMFEIVATFYDMEVPDTCKENLSEMDNH